MVATLDFENRNLMIGKRWDSLRNSWTAFVTSVCTNDPGHVTDPNRFISTHSLDLTCCINDFCLTEIVSAVQSESMNGSLLVLFVDQRSNSAICKYSKEDLISSFVAKNSRKNALNLADCENYENLEGKGLEKLSVKEKELYINLSNKASKSSTWTSEGSSSGAQKPQIKQNAIISRDEKVTKYPQTWVMLCTSSCKQSIAHTHLETRKLCLAFISLPLIYQCLQFEWCFSYFMFGLLLWNIAPKHFSKIGCGVISCGSVSREGNPNAQQ